MQTGSTFAFPVTQSASPSGASGEGAPATAGLAGAANLNGAAGGVLGGASLVPGSRSPVILGPGSVGGLASAGSNGGLPSAAVQAQYMQAIMQQPQGFPFGQFPPHFGHGTFNGSASHMGAQQVGRVAGWVSTVGGFWDEVGIQSIGRGFGMSLMMDLVMFAGSCAVFRGGCSVLHPSHDFALSAASRTTDWKWKWRWRLKSHWQAAAAAGSRGSRLSKCRIWCARSSNSVPIAFAAARWNARGFKGWREGRFDGWREWIVR